MTGAMHQSATHLDSGFNARRARCTDSAAEEFLYVTSIDIPPWASFVERPWAKDATRGSASSDYAIARDARGGYMRQILGHPLLSPGFAPW